MESYTLGAKSARQRDAEDGLNETEIRLERTWLSGKIATVSAILFLFTLTFWTILASIAGSQIRLFWNSITEKVEKSWMQSVFYPETEDLKGYFRKSLNAMFVAEIATREGLLFSKELRCLESGKK